MIMRTELTLDEAMADPMILLIMKADRVDPAKLRHAWTPLIDQLRAHAKTDEAAADESADQDAPKFWRHLAGDCVRSAWSASAKPGTKAGLR